MRWYGWLGMAVAGVAGLAFYVYTQKLDQSLQPSTPEELAELRAQIDAQNEAAFSQPPSKARNIQGANDLNNVYFGDLHVHTDISFDSYLFGNRLSPDDAYRIAKGESAEIATGERVALTRPLDFAALTDHAEGFGQPEACARDNLSSTAQSYCAGLDNPSVRTFLELRASGLQRPMVRDLTIYEGSEAVALKLAATTWERVKAAAEQHYEPGTFTTFAGYEYSPVLADRGKHHRNIIFRSMDTPSHAVSAYDAPSEIDLWKQLEATCRDECRFLTIPHNPNKTWGLAFASQTIDGMPYNDDDWRLRARSEPLVEMFQAKGNSECSQAFGAGDEECGFEQFLPACEPGQETTCIFPTSMVRDGLKKGLVLEDEIGVNPLQFGLIGSTDTHNSNPGDTEEWDFRGTSGYLSSPAVRRLNGSGSNSAGARLRNPGGLAAVWARENTREALFDSMMRKEVYATSGTRIRLRVFAGFDLPEDLAQTGDLKAAYANGIPMGGTLTAQDQPPSLFVWAIADPNSAPLARVQVIKGWIENGSREEAVYDIACGGSQIDLATGQCRDNNATVDLTNCAVSETAGSAELKTQWRDPDFDASEDAFYYVRVVQNPTCRWTTYDSLRIGQELPNDVPATITEMAWSSPIWVTTSSEPATRSRSNRENQ